MLYRYLHTQKKRKEKKRKRVTDHFNLHSISVPEVNVAHTKFGAQVLQGEMRTALLDGDTTNYDMERGKQSNLFDYESDNRRDYSSIKMTDSFW